MIGVVRAVSLVINILGASGSKSQRVAPHGVDRTMFLVMLEVTWHSWRLLGAPAPGGCSAVFMVCWTCPHAVHLPGPAPAEVPGSSLIVLR